MSEGDQHLDRHDLGAMATRELQTWLEAERACVQKFVTNPTLDVNDPRAVRARQASGRVKVLESELETRASGRLPRGQ